MTSQLTSGNAPGGRHCCTSAFKFFCFQRAPGTIFTKVTCLFLALNKEFVCSIDNYLSFQRTILKYHEGFVPFLSEELFKKLEN